MSPSTNVEVCSCSNDAAASQCRVFTVALVAVAPATTATSGNILVAAVPSAAVGDQILDLRPKVLPALGPSYTRRAPHTT